MITQYLLNIAKKRPADIIIGDELSPYLKRWFLVRQNKLLNIYLHHFLRSDDDRALHDHPWCNASVLLKGSYVEHYQLADHTVTQRTVRQGMVIFRKSGKFAHRIELKHGACWTVFITGPKYRKWGFHCESGWIPWNQFLSKNLSKNGTRGCS